MPEDTNVTQLAVAASPEQQGAMEVRAQVNQIQYLMQSVLREGEHYGVIPGTGKKPSLLQSGAEKIALMFGWTFSKPEVERTDFNGGHREYMVTVTLINRKTGEIMGSGMGSCSTLESKYRYRWVGKNPNRQRQENPDIADTWNTVLKMAIKRAKVDAVKSTAAASDIFTQDIEDMPSYLLQGRSQSQPAPQAQAQTAAAADPVDRAWVADAAGRLAAAAYDRQQCSDYLAWVWAQKGRAEAEAEVSRMLAGAPGVDDVAVELDETEVA